MNRITELCKIIKEAKDELTEIRKTCSHGKTYEGFWMDERPGNMIHANICNECQTFVSNTGKDTKPYPEYGVGNFSKINK